MPTELNLVGHVYGRLTVVSKARARNTQKELKWHCLCTCGKKVDVSRKLLRNGHTQSCGCLRIETAILHGRGIEHGLTYSPGWWSWYSMVLRCHHTTTGAYKNYGARGLEVCPRWRESFIYFLEDMGSRPENTSIDRIDGAKGYFKENCRWATRIEQGNNKHTNRKITVHGKTYGISEWARSTGIHKTTLLNRLNRGWSDEDAILIPLKKRQKTCL